MGQALFGQQRDDAQRLGEALVRTPRCHVQQVGVGRRRSVDRMKDGVIDAVWNDGDDARNG